MSVRKFVRQRGVGASTETLDATVEERPPLGLVIEINGVPLNRRDWDQFKKDVDHLVIEVTA